MYVNYILNQINGDKMQYIMFWEFEPEKREEVIKKLNEIRKEIKSNPDKYPKFISKNYAMVDGPEGFQLVETDDPEHLSRFVLHYMPEVRFRFAPIIEVAKSVELYNKEN
jgi:hypothetical protein